MEKVRLATAWLDGCSGCHMSLLDLDEQLLDVAGRIELVYSPLVDAHDIPDKLDVALVEGAVASTADREKLMHLRRSARILVAFGDCAVTANVPAMRNRFAPADVLQRAYVENAALAGRIPGEALPRLLPQVKPVHAHVAVDCFLPGCPPPAEAIAHLLTSLLAGAMPDMTGRSRFGA